MENCVIYVNPPEYCTGMCSDYLKLHCLLTEWLRKVRPDAKDDLKKMFDNVINSPIRVI